MNRRQFIKNSAGAVAATSIVLSACRRTSADGNRRSAEPTTEPAGTMTLRRNHNTGDEVSLLGFGMMRLPVMEGGTARENPDSPIDQEVVNEMVDYALAHGVNFFDTSPAYCQGLSERSTGIALKRHPRNAYFISTKLSNFSPETWPAEESKAMFEHSLSELQTDYVDYLLMHGIGLGGGGKDAMEAFHGRYINNGLLDWLVVQKKAGRIRNLGFSFHGDRNVLDKVLRWHDEGRYHWDFALIELNYLDWNYAREINPRNVNASLLYEEFYSRHIPLLVMEPLLGGRLAKQPDAIMRKLQNRRPGSSSAEWAFRFAGTKEGILSVLSGMTYMEHLQENVRTYSPLEPLSDDEERFLLGIAEEICSLKAIPCTACNYCMPCPYGLNIPAIFSHYNQCLSEERMPHESNEQREYRRLKRAFLVGYDRSVPRLRQADHCIGCNHCVSHCPQRIDIPKEMMRINSFVERLKQTGE